MSVSQKMWEGGSDSRGGHVTTMSASKNGCTRISESCEIDVVRLLYYYKIVINIIKLKLYNRNVANTQRLTGSRKNEIARFRFWRERETHHAL